MTRLQVKDCNWKLKESLHMYMEVQADDFHLMCRGV